MTELLYALAMEKESTEVALVKLSVKRCFLKYFLFFVDFKIGLLGLCLVFPSLMYILAYFVYAPEIWFTDFITSAKGDTLKTTPIIAWFEGVLLYSLLASAVVCFIKTRR